VSYIDENLVSGERVIFRTRLHWIIIWNSAFALGFTALIAVPIFFGTFNLRFEPAWWCIVIPAILGGAGMGALHLISSEFGVTNRRVLVKTGFIIIRTLELNIGKLESVQVRATLFGALFGYKHIMVIGSGGTRQQFRFVRDADTFRQHVTEQGMLISEESPALRQSAAPALIEKRKRPPSPLDDLPDEPELADVTSRVRAIVALIRAGQRDQAAADLRVLRTDAPNNADVWYLTGYLASDRDDKRTAFERALYLDPKHQKAIDALSKLNR
jgi:hypothetical protein